MIKIAKKRKPKRRKKKGGSSMVRMRKRKKAGREFTWNYFFLHNFLSMLIFFVLAVVNDLYSYQSTDVIDMLRFSFLEFVGGVFLLSVISSVIGRVLSYTILYLIYDSALNQVPLSFWMTQKDGKNRMDLSYVVRTLLTSIAFASAFYITMQVALFQSNNLGTFILTYIIINSTIGFIVFLKYK